MGASLCLSPLFGRFLWLVGLYLAVLGGLLALGEVRLERGEEGGGCHLITQNTSKTTCSPVVFESPVQSGLWPIFGKTETKTGL